MSRDATVIAFRQPDAIDDPLTELARERARPMLAQVLIAEADAFVAMWKDEKLPDVRRAKVGDRGEVGAEEKIRFSSAILPK
jgi:putative transposase